MMAKGMSKNLLSAVTYGAVAIAANFINKGAMIVLPGHPNAVLMLQLVAMYCTVQVLKSSSLVVFPPFSVARCKQLLPLSLAYAAHAAMVLRSLAFLNVAVYNTLKRLTPVLVLLFKALQERKAPGLQESVCVGLIVMGCIVAGAGDLSFSISGYSAALFCAVLQAIYIMLAEANDRSHSSKGGKTGHSGGGAGGLKTGAGGAPLQHGSISQKLTEVNTVEAAHKGDGSAPAAAPLQHSHLSSSHIPLHPADEAADRSESQRLLPQPTLGRTASAGAAAATAAVPALSSASEVLYYAAILSMPLLAAAVVVSREAGVLPGNMARVYERLGGIQGGAFVSWIASLAWVETALAGTLVWCTECNGGLTTSIVGVLKGVVAVALGLFFMAGPSQVTYLNLAGIGMVLVGGSWYSSLKCLEKKNHH